MAEYDRPIPKPSPLLRAVWREEQQQPRTLNEELLGGKTSAAAAIEQAFADTDETGVARIRPVLLRTEAALDSSVCLAWEEGGQHKQETVSLEDLLILLARREAGQDVRVVQVGAPSTGNSPIFWQAAGSVWLPTRPQVAAHFYAWDDRRAAAAAILDPEFGRIVLRGSITLREAFLQRNPKFASEVATIRKARGKLGDDVPNIVASTVAEGLLSEDDDGGTPLVGIVVSGLRHNEDPAPEWSRTAERKNRRWEKLQQAVVKALGTDAFGMGIHSPRSRQRVESLDQRVEEERGDPSHLAEDAIGPEEAVVSRELLNQLAQLPYFEDFSAVKVLGMSQSEVARQRGITEARVSQRLKEFREAAKKLLNSD